MTWSLESRARKRSVGFVCVYSSGSMTGTSRMGSAFVRILIPRGSGLARFLSPRVDLHASLESRVGQRVGAVEEIVQCNGSFEPASRHFDDEVVGVETTVRRTCAGREPVPLIRRRNNCFHMNCLSDFCPSSSRRSLTCSDRDEALSQVGV